MLIEVIDDINNYEYLVISKTARGLVFDLDELGEYFKNNKVVNTRFIIDCLLVVGNKDNRFIVGNYLDGKIDYKSIQEKKISSDNEIRVKSMEYFKSNKRLIDNSILNSSIKDLLIYGVAV